HAVTEGPRTKDGQGPRTAKDQGRPRTKDGQGPRTAKDQGRTKAKARRTKLSDLSKSPAHIAAMFDAIAGRYDFLNHLLSAGIDRRWRRQAIASLSLTGRERVLDVCSGTADLAMEAARRAPGAKTVVGVDFAGAMLRIGRE